MTKSEYILGFLVPDEYREELNKVFEKYENLDRATLMALLLQNELTLLKLRKEVQDKIIMEVFREKPLADEVMTRLEKLIGFPVPQEHRKELNERLQMYENSDRTALISLLLQYDWELIQICENNKA